jgi:hypothetical protein
MGRRQIVSLVSLLGAVILILMEAFAKQLEDLLSLSAAGRIRLEIGVLTATLLVILNIMFHLSVAQAEETTEQMRLIQESMLTTMRSLEGRIVMLTSDDLYRELRISAECARSRIYTSYMGETPPTGTTVRSKKLYFELMTKLPKRNAHVICRRMIAGTSANAPWISSLVEEYRGVRNVSIAVYEPPARFPSLSMLFFDDDSLYIVNVASRPPGQYRDIKIFSRDVANIMDALYERMWLAATVLLDAGIPREAELTQFLARVATSANSVAN